MNWDIIITELKYRTSRSSGAGGQHVNKTETKVEVLLDVNTSGGLTLEEKEVIRIKLINRINDEGILSVTSQKSRSQFDNKENATDKLNHLIIKALAPVTKRKRTKPTLSSIEERLTEKKIHSEKKSARKKPGV